MCLPHYRNLLLETFELLTLTRCWWRRMKFRSYPLCLIEMSGAIRVKTAPRIRAYELWRTRHGDGHASIIEDYFFFIHNRNKSMKTFLFPSQFNTLKQPERVKSPQTNFGMWETKLANGHMNSIRMTFKHSNHFIESKSIVGAIKMAKIIRETATNSFRVRKLREVVYNWLYLR